MLVDVVALRHRGLRLPPDDVRATEPVRGVLSLDLKGARWRANERDPRLVAMLLSEGEPAMLLEPLDFARVVKIKRSAFLIVGTQRYIRPERVVEDFRQAWWVRPVVQITHSRSRPS